MGFKNYNVMNVLQSFLLKYNTSKEYQFQFKIWHRDLQIGSIMIIFYG